MRKVVSLNSEEVIVQNKTKDGTLVLERLGLFVSGNGVLVARPPVEDTGSDQEGLLREPTIAEMMAGNDQF